MPNSLPWLIVAVQLVVMCFFLYQAYRQRFFLRVANERLAESEARFRMVFEKSGVGMALFTPQRQFVEVNPALVRLLGFPAEDLCGKRLADFLHQDDGGGGLSRSEQGLDEPLDLYEREKHFRHRDGHHVWARVVWVPVRTSQGQLCNLVGVLIDITERRKAELALAASEQRYRLRFLGAFDGIFACDESGIFLDANPAFCQMLGFEAENLLGRSLVDVAGDLPQLRKHLAALKSQGSDRFETSLRHKNGARVDVEVCSTMLEVDNRRILNGISRDISQRKQAEQFLRHSEERHRAILGTSLDALIILNSQGCIVEFNTAAEAMFRRLSAAASGKNFAEWLLAPDSKRVFRRAWVSGLKNGSDLNLGCRLELEALRRPRRSLPGGDGG